MALSAGCAAEPVQMRGGTEVSPSHERFVVEARAYTFEAEVLDAVRCTFGNDKGSWQVVAPGVVTVERSQSPLSIRCEKEGFEPFVHALQCKTPRERAAEGSIGVAFGPLWIGPVLAGAALATMPGGECYYTEGRGIAFRLRPGPLRQ